MKKFLFSIFFLFLINFSLSEETAEKMIVSEQGLCNVSESFINSISPLILSELNLSDYEYSNITYSGCYYYDTYKSLNFEVIAKKTSEEIIEKTISVSIYSGEEYDFNKIFTETEKDVLDYYLKNNYAVYLINNTDNEYYVKILGNYSSKNPCAGLKEYFDSLQGEKYFEEGYDYCIITLKTKTSELKDLVLDKTGYIYYLGEDITFYFQGYSEGNFDVWLLSRTLDCDITKADYYYPEEESNCYGIYKEKTRVYFSKSIEYEEGFYVHLSVYGIQNGKGKISSGIYGKNINLETASKFISDSVKTYFGIDYIPELKKQSESEDWTSYTAEKSIDSLYLDSLTLEGMKKSEYLMDTQYSDTNTYITISEPYIRMYTTAEETSADLLRIMPLYYRGKDITITKNRIYSSAEITENNSEKAEAVIRLITDNYVETDIWTLKMSVNGGGYYPLYSAMEKALDIMSVGEDSSGISDSFNSNYPDFAEFESKEKKSILTKILDFFIGLFK